MGALTVRARTLVPYGRAFVKAWWSNSAKVVPTSDGMLPLSYPWNYWQCALPGADPGPNPTVEACVAAYARVIGQLPIRHWRRRKDGGRDEVTTSAATRVMRRPNSYQTRADFFYNLVDHELHKGNGYAVAVRNGREEVDSLHIVPDANARGFLDAGSKEIFYGVGNNDFLPITPDYVDRWDFIVPQRDMLHLRIQCPRNPLEGVPPLVGAAMAVQTGNAIAMNQQAFFTNFSRASGVLESDVQLTPKQIDELRAKWEDQTKGIAAGGVPILAWGLKYKPITTNATDAALIETYKMTVKDISKVYGVPLAIINESGDATFSNVLQMLSHWKSAGLGYMLEHIELALDYLFGLSSDEWLEFDVENGLLRSDFMSRVEAYAKGIQGGLFSPNEAREQFDMGKVDGGKDVRLQAQVVPLSNAYQTPSAPAAPAATAAPGAPQSGNPPKDPTPPPQDPKPPAKELDEWAEGRVSKLIGKHRG